MKKSVARNVRKPLVAAYSKLVVHTGVASLCRRLRRHDGASVFMEHSVNPYKEGYLPVNQPHIFERQVAYLAKHYNIIPLSQLLDIIENDSEFPPRTAVITIDDGYRDNYEYAFPVLKKYNAPATIFLVTGAIETGKLPWINRIAVMIRKTREQKVKLDLPAGEFDLSTKASRFASYHKIWRALKSLSARDREVQLKSISVKLGVTPPNNRMLTWDQIDEMAASVIDFGGHTHTHPLMEHIAEDEARFELQQSCDIVSRHFQIPRPTFAFPGGSFNEDLVRMASEVGYRCSFRSDYWKRYNYSHQVTPYTISRSGFTFDSVEHFIADLETPLRRIRQIIGV